MAAASNSGVFTQECHFDIETLDDAEAESSQDTDLNNPCIRKQGHLAKPKKHYSLIQNSHRMHRPSVWPLFCCGSELSLVSIPDNLPKIQQCVQMGKEPGNVTRHSQFFAAYSNTKSSHKKQQSVTQKSKYSWISNLRRRKRFGRKSQHRPSSCHCSDVDCLCDIFTDGCSTSNSIKLVPGACKSAHCAARSTGKKNKGAKRNGGAVVRQTRARHADRNAAWDDVCMNRVNATTGLMRHSSLLQNRRIVNRLCSSFQRGCELPDSECSAVYQEFGDMPHALSGMARCGRSPSLTAHTQVDYIHYLVPDLLEISKRSFYWGVMDRYEAERLLDNKPEGTFLLRDSAQEDFLFSVSFRRYGRSLHARIEQWKHKFSFDSHDPGVFATETVCGLIEHYKDPSCCMFFEPMLTKPLHRSFPFSLQHLCRSVVCSDIKYDDVNQLPLPVKIKECLKYYHYKQKVRVRKLDSNEEIALL